MMAAHEQRETLHQDYIIPAHKERTTTALFRRSKEQLLAENPRCWICGATEEEAGAPLEAHHVIIERCWAEGHLDWEGLMRDCIAGEFGREAQAFDWRNFDPTDPYSFVDSAANLRLLCAAHHRGADEGVHALTLPVWLIQRYLPEGYRFSPGEVIHHHDP
jgi:hypothetical protein